MRKLVALLSVCCVSLAIACGVLYRELAQERAAKPVAETQTPTRIAESNTQPAPLEMNEEPEVESTFRATPLENASPAEAGAERRPNRQAERRNEMRAELERRRADPQWQARALVRAKSQVRRQRPDLGAALGLSAQQEDAFVELLARQELQQNELRESMRFADQAEQSAIRAKGEALAQQQEQERAAQLGSQYQAFEIYSRQQPERQQLRELRSRLDANQSLSESQTARLVDAMYQERESYLQQFGDVANVVGYSAGYPIIASPRSGDPQAQVRFAEEQVARDEAFQSRLRQRAAQILSASQLRRFDELQEEQLLVVRNQVERAKNRAERQARRQSRAGSSTR